MPYNRLIAFAILANVALFGYGIAAGWWTENGITLGPIAVAAQTNLALAIVIRQQHVTNFLSWAATRAPVSWPLSVRWALSKVYHVGGLHVGGAICGTLWHLVFTASLIHEAMAGHDVATANLVLSGALAAVFLIIVVMAMPGLRARAHDRFEATHRFCGWAAVALTWANTVVFTVSQHGAGGRLTAPAIWLLVLTTASSALPWLRLRKVPVVVHRPSAHVAVVSLYHRDRPIIGSARAISRNPVLGWHAFANIPAARGAKAGYRMLVSRAGNWTSEFIDNPPTHVWVRGVPAAGVGYMKKLFTKVVYVATGSGIGPILAHLLADETPSQLVWVTRGPRETYGDALVDEILAAQPDAVIWNTDERGKPDVLDLAYNACLSSGAEAVICISNKKVTEQVVHGLERRGIPACGPIWDS